MSSSHQVISHGSPLSPPTRRELIARHGFFNWFFRTARGDAPYQRVLIHLVLIAACVITVYPLTRILSVSLRPGDALLSTTMEVIPENATFAAYYNVIVQREFLIWIWNSIIVALSGSFIGVAIAATGAYAFSRWDFPLKVPALIFLLCTQMIPAPMMVVPIYIIAANLGILNSWIGIIVAYSVQSTPFSIWILKGYYDTVPYELEQQAMVDGSSHLGAFYRIILPLSTPALAIAFLFNFTQAWNDWVLARVMLTNDLYYTWPLGVNRLQGQFTTLWSEFYAASFMISIPVLALFLASSRFLISGLTLGSVKD